MGILGRIERFLEERKQYNIEHRRVTAFKKKRGNLSIIKFRCGSCGHDKGFMKGSIIKCTKCKEMVRI